MNYWIMKSEPSVYSIDDLKAEKNKTEFWDGIRNYQARNFIRDKMIKNDAAFFYHSSCKEPGIYGMIKISSAAYPDTTAQDPKSKYYDPKSTKDNPIWLGVDVKFVKKFNTPILLTTLKENTKLSDMQLLKKGNRLSIMQITKHHWSIILGHIQ